MGFVNWINGIIGDAASGLAGLASSVAARIVALYNLVVGFWTTVRNTVIRMRDFVNNFLASIINTAAKIFLTIKWILVTVLPREINGLLNIVISYVTGRLASLFNTLMNAITIVKTFFNQLIAHLTARLESVILWAAQHIDDILHRLHLVEIMVFGVLATPLRLVGWILDTLVTALWHWVLDHALALLRALWGARTTVILEGVNFIEDILTRIL
jgi:hypothetical protein